MNNFFLLLILFLILGCRNDNITKSITPPVNIEVKTGNFDFGKLTLVSDGLKFETMALGRETFKGANDAPKLKLVDEGLAHPSVLYIPEGFGGYKFWCALTPYFGVVMKYPDPAQYENPHIFFSNDGMNWSESVNRNPIDLPYPLKSAGPYWSDVNLAYDNGELYLYYRGTAFPKNYFGDNLYHNRSVVVKTSQDGENWSEKRLLYSSTLTKNVDLNSLMVSPSFLKDLTTWCCYDVVYSTKNNPIEPQKNQSQGFVMRRIDDSPTGNFGDYSKENICNFLNRPWGETYDPWHLEVVKYDDTFFMLLNVGLVSVSHGDALYLAYSKDGINFRVINQPLFEKNTYKSSLSPISSNSEKVNFKLYRSVKSTGKIELYDFSINKT